MNSSTIAIIILSGLLAIATGLLVWSQLSGDKNLKEAQQQTKEALKEKAALNADFEQQKLLDAKKDATIKQQAATLANNSTTINNQKNTIAMQDQQLKDAHNISGVVLTDTKNVQEWYDEGHPIVAQLDTPILNNWYDLGGPLFLPLFQHETDLNNKITDITASNTQLKSDNTDLFGQNSLLKIDNDNMKAQHLEDVSLHQDEQTHSDALQLNLDLINKDLTNTRNRELFFKIGTVTFAVTTAGAIIWALVK